MDLEQKQLFGFRESDSDGFTYVHGKFKQGRVKRSRNKNKTRKLVRSDKRSVKSKSLKRELKEQI
jgi:hypothetical protein